MLGDRPRVLVCDDDSQSLRALRAVLCAAGFELDPTATAEEALGCAALREPDAAIVELVLPDGDGVEVCRRLREWSAMPLIVLSAVGEEVEKVRALQAGADDYVTKPFVPGELVARLKATLRRANSSNDRGWLQLDGLDVDLAARSVCCNGEEVQLTPIEFKLLGALVTNRGRVLTHNHLLREVWGGTYPECRQTLRAHIANLRRKLEFPGRLPLIRTEHGVGYRFAHRGEQGSPCKTSAAQPALPSEPSRQLRSIRRKSLDDREVSSGAVKAARYRVLQCSA